MIKVEIKLFFKDCWMLEVDDKSQGDKNVSDAAAIILERLLTITKPFTAFRKNNIWYLTGKSKKEAMERIVITEGGGSEGSMALVCRDLIKYFPMITEKIWNDCDDTILCSNYIQNDLFNFSYRVVVNFDSEEEVLCSIFPMLTEIIANISPKIVRVETNNYSMSGNHVFPDRIPVGWMFYTNTVYSEALPGFKGKIHTVTRGNEPIGTLFVSKKGFFDGSKKEDIEAANDLEIMLVSHDILPTYSNIF